MEVGRENDRQSRVFSGLQADVHSLGDSETWEGDSGFMAFVGLERRK